MRAWLLKKLLVTSCAAKDDAEDVREEAANGKLKRASSTLAVGPIVAEKGDVCVLEFVRVYCCLLCFKMT